MIYSYSETGVIATQDGTISAIVDTDSPAFIARIQWIRQKTGLDQPEILRIVAQSPGDPTPNITGVLNWTREGRQVGTDCFLTMRNPEVALASLAVDLGLNIPGIEHMKYVEVAIPKDINDWDQPGAPIGPPLDPERTWFDSRRQGQPEGFVWTAPSGNRYRLDRRGTFAMFSYPAWKKL